MLNPAGDFVAARIDIKDIERSFHRAIVDLLNSDIPLDPEARRWIARHYDHLAFPDKTKNREWRNRLKAGMADLSEGETNEAKAKKMGMNVHALLKLKQRYLKK